MNGEEKNRLTIMEPSLKNVGTPTTREVRRFGRK